MGIKKYIDMFREKKEKYQSYNNPFFIVGCVRSGTTMLRDMLRKTPGLYSPEETHFFRDGAPFGTPHFQHFIMNNKILKKHRKIDGITEKEFEILVSRSHTKQELMDRYMSLFVSRKTSNPKNARWYDKTPQNVYGILLISHMFPTSKFVHIYRNPLNVVASLKLGEIMPVMSAVAAANYWLESMIIIDHYKKIAPHRVHEIKYEALLLSPNEIYASLLKFLNIYTKAKDFSSFIKPEINKYKKVLTNDEQKKVLEICNEYIEKYSYNCSGDINAR